MSNQSSTIGTGAEAPFILSYEPREIVVAQGLDFHESDKLARWNQWESWANVLESNPTPDTLDELADEMARANNGNRPDLRSWSERQRLALAANLRRGKPLFFHDYLSEILGSDYTKYSEESAEYTSEAQKVHFNIRIVTAKTAFKEALETEGIMVIYAGHSRYGRGACFDVYEGLRTPQGDQWDPGSTFDNGLFRLAYPFVLVHFKDIQHHQYKFMPVAVEDGTPDWSQRHPDARRRLSKISIPTDLESLITPYYKSPSGKYWGARFEGLDAVLLYAGWNDTVNTPLDLGGTELRCKTFCHFGCSSERHFWPIVRTLDFKGWQRDDPPTNNFAYFTIDPADGDAAVIWVRHWLAYPNQNNWESWWASLAYAKRSTNEQLRYERRGFLIY